MGENNKISDGGKSPSSSYSPKNENKKQGDGKTANPLDFRYLLETVVSMVRTHVSKVSPAPCDGLLLYLHYRWTVWALFGGFLAVFHSWYHKDNIVCVSHFNAELPVREEYVNVCLSYPYLQEDGKRRYILFYRWVHWSFLLLAFLFYLPRKVSKNFNSAECKKLLEDLSKEDSAYEQKEDKVVNKVYNYMIFNIRTHNGIYWKYLAVNTMALVVDFCALKFLDFVLQGRFIHYGYKSFPFDRDPENFSDYMSQTFPPFVSCELTVNNQLVSRRTEKFGCHLTLMELYEKIFLGLWLWLIALMSLTFCYIIFLLSLLLPIVRLLLLRFSKPVNATTKSVQIIRDVLKHSRVGDVYVLYCMKQYLSHVRFWEVMVKFANPQAYERVKDEESVKDTNSTSAKTQKPQTQQLRERSKPYKKDITVTFPETTPLSSTP